MSVAEYIEKCSLNLIKSLTVEHHQNIFCKFQLKRKQNSPILTFYGCVEK